ncbi:unnamed protein product, partial [Rotaria sp. Silwood2]
MIEEKFFFYAFIAHSVLYTNIPQSSQSDVLLLNYTYTTQFHDDTGLGETSSNMAIAKRARRELEIYLQLNLTNCKYLNDDIDNPLLFWKEQEHVLP